jgi:hypothetical protein
MPFGCCPGRRSKMSTLKENSEARKRLIEESLADMYPEEDE